MKRIGLISDTHNFLDEAVFRHFQHCDEIWHAGDFGAVGIADHLKEKTGLPLRGVYGNIDGRDVRSGYPQKLVWTCEEVKVYMTHIGGYPGRYAPGIKQELQESGARLFICGHSHILKVIYDDKLACLHMNPGAAGNQGWHKVRTLLRFTIDGAAIKDCEVIELGTRGSLPLFP
ncbi:MAG: metallophosphatase family protein [Bacteroidota bacterium]|nr:metallophosphatase family protein [Bacteroidota bacterium]